MADEDDFLFDDDLDDLPTNTIEQIEQEALSSTQRSYIPPLRKQAHNASSLHRAAAPHNKNLPWRPPQPTRPLVQQQRYLKESAPPASAPEPPSSDYGFHDDEDVIDLDEPSMVIQPALRPETTRSATGGNGSRVKQRVPDDLETEAAFAAADAELLGSQTFGRWQNAYPAHTAQSAAGTMDVSALQKRIADLEAEQSHLKRSEQQARSEARAKQGEIAIVRSNQDKLTKQYEARISVMQRLHADESAKAKAELELQRKQREKTETDNRFLQHDLAQEADRARKVNGPTRSRTAPTATQKLTPRKSKRQILGDGFDNEEIHVVSPSKSKERTREEMHKIGAKRKRPANDSPATALSFNQPCQPLIQESSEHAVISFEQPASETSVVPDDSRYQYMQLILNHKPHEGHQRTIEALSKYTFPSSPDISLSSIIVDGITATPFPGEPLVLQVCHVLLDMWRRCQEERVFDAFYLILDMLRFALRSELASVKAQIIEEAVPLCTNCLALVPVALGRASSNRTYAASLDRKALDKLAEELEEDEIIEFLHELCDASSLSADRNEVFWTTMDLGVVGILLRKTSPIHHILTTLKMLNASVRPLTFGVIDKDITRQSEFERTTTELLTQLLFQIPDGPKDEAPYTDEELLELRIEVLQVLREICQTDHGSLQLAQHRSAIGRLVRFLDTQVSRLYRVRPAVGLVQPSPTVHDLISRSVNLATRILYHLLKLFEDPTAITQKLSAQTGGYHRFIVSLTRIALREELIFEAGIDAEVSEAAHLILDSFLSPEDGEAVVQAFETPRGTRGTLSQRVGRSGGQSQDDDDTTMGDFG